MPFRHSVRFGAFRGLPLRRAAHGGRKGRLLIALGLLTLLAILAFSLYLRSLSSSMAISDAKDAVALAINGCVSRIIQENNYGSNYFVKLEKDAEGNITAITTDTMHINELSSQLLSEIAKAADSETLNIRIPLGSLLGSNLLMGRGPEIPVEIIMLTSSFVQFENELIPAGINQSRHVVTLKADVDVDILIPWATITNTVETDVLIAETVIVGRVPETYVTVTEGHNGSK